jgi:hypothetical protein
MGRKRAWGGREPGAEAKAGADGSMGRTVVWGSPRGQNLKGGADGSMGRKGAWGGKEYGVLGTPRHIKLHFDPQATTFLSPPGCVYCAHYLIRDIDHCRPVLQPPATPPTHNCVS